MPDNSANSKRLARNTLFLYLRMLVVMGVGLYTTRMILSLLGVVDYGIYNVVGGVVSMFAFLRGTLSTSSQRYFSIELAKGNITNLRQWFCLNITGFFILIICFLIIAETIGLWFVNNKLVIPQERLFAANVVYQISLISFSLNFFAIPYHALIIAHEKMSAFAYISIVEALFKLIIVLVLSIITWDKLILYGILTFISSSSITLTYIVYNRKHFIESRYHFFWDKTKIVELLSFSGWHFYGTFSTTIRSQGINILLNMFFSPAVNAARAVSYQVYHAVSILSSNFFIALKPQIYKTYASKQYDELYKLILRSTVICFVLVAILVFPVLSNTGYVLNLWLKNVPEYAITFTQLILINGLIESLNGPTIAAILATGKIRKYELIAATLTIMNLPFSYVALRLGAPPTSTIVISILIMILITLYRALTMCRMIHVPLKLYIHLFLKIFVVIALSVGIIYMLFYNSACSLIALISQSVIVSLMIAFFSFTFLLEKTDRATIFNIMKQKFRLLTFNSLR